jgi:hypothetical protein
MFAYQTHDEVNADLARTLCDHCGLAVEVTDLRDQPPGERHRAVAYDVDSLPEAERRQLLAVLQSTWPPRPVALHSYNLKGATVTELRKQGVAVFRRLDERAFRHLARMLSRPQAAETVVDCCDDAPVPDDADELVG